MIVLANVCGTLIKMRNVSIRAISKRPPPVAGAFVPFGVVPAPGNIALDEVVPVEVLRLELSPGLINDPTSTFRAVITPSNGE